MSGIVSRISKEPVKLIDSKPGDIYSRLQKNLGKLYFFVSFRAKLFLDLLISINTAEFGMSTNMQPQFEEKRFALRMSLRLPIVISGRADDGAAWSEPTETDDISTTGALFHLNQKIVSGENLYLRSHRPDGVPVEVKAQVVRTSPAAHGTTRVGVNIIEPTDSWLRLFVAWIADDQEPVEDNEE